MKESPRSEQADLDRRSFSFVLRSSEELKSGDMVIVRQVRETANGDREVVAVPEKAVREEAEKLLS